jgi:hypothetical protein
MWRRLLIELSDEHRESILLNWCIRELSQLGYHREIAQVIREADYFSVCNELLVDTLFRLGTAIAEGGSVESSASVSVASDSTNSTGTGTGTGNDDISSLMTDLKRMCGTTEYMFIYTHSLLSEILAKLSPDTSTNRSQSRGKKRSIAHVETGTESGMETGPAGGDKEEGEEGEEEGEVVVGEEEGCMKHMWAQKVRRVREELEDHRVWRRDVRGFSSRGWRMEPISGAAKFALQLTSGNEAIGVCSHGGGVSDGGEGRGVQELVRGVLENGSVTNEFVEQLFGFFFQRCEESTAGGGDGASEFTEEVVKLLPETQAALTAQFAGGACDGVDYPPRAFTVLHHSQVLHMLIMFLVQGSNHINNTATSHATIAGANGSSSARSRSAAACVLALASCAHEPTYKEYCKSASLGSLTDTSADPGVVLMLLADKISQASDICLSLGSLVSYIVFVGMLVSYIQC